MLLSEGQYAAVDGFSSCPGLQQHSAADLLMEDLCEERPGGETAESGLKTTRLRRTACPLFKKTRADRKET